MPSLIPSITLCARDGARQHQVEINIGALDRFNVGHASRGVRFVPLGGVRARRELVALNIGGSASSDDGVSDLLAAFGGWDVRGSTGREKGRDEDEGGAE